MIWGRRRRRSRTSLQPEVMRDIHGRATPVRDDWHSMLGCLSARLAPATVELMDCGSYARVADTKTIEPGQLDAANAASWV